MKKKDKKKFEQIVESELWGLHKVRNLAKLPRFFPRTLEEAAFILVGVLPMFTIRTFPITCPEEMKEREMAMLRKCESGTPDQQAIRAGLFLDDRGSGVSGLRMYELLLQAHASNPYENLGHKVGFFKEVRVRKGDVWKHIPMPMRKRINAFVNASLRVKSGSVREDVTKLVETLSGMGKSNTSIKGRKPLALDDKLSLRKRITEIGEKFNLLRPVHIARALKKHYQLEYSEKTLQNWINSEKLLESKSGSGRSSLAQEKQEEELIKYLNSRY